VTIEQRLRELAPQVLAAMRPRSSAIASPPSAPRAWSSAATSPPAPSDWASRAERIDVAACPCQADAVTPSCPRCSESVLSKMVVHGAWVMTCSSCWGLWIDHGSLGQLSQRALEGASSTIAEGLACPMCRATLHASNVRGVVVDHCHVHGVWFDRSELDHALGIQQLAATGAVVVAAAGASAPASGTDTVGGALEMVDASLPVVEVVAEAAGAHFIVEGIGTAVGAIFELFS
jgi:Zn-finger nucleic acid-binding protein